MWLPFVGCITRHGTDTNPVLHRVRPKEPKCRPTVAAPNGCVGGRSPEVRMALGAEKEDAASIACQIWYVALYCEGRTYADQETPGRLQLAGEISTGQRNAIDPVCPRATSSPKATTKASLDESKLSLQANPIYGTDTLDQSRTSRPRRRENLKKLDEILQHRRQTRDGIDAHKYMPLIYQA